MHGILETDKTRSKFYLISFSIFLFSTYKCHRPHVSNVRSMPLPTTSRELSKALEHEKPFLIGPLDDWFKYQSQMWTLFQRRTVKFRLFDVVESKSNEMENIGSQVGMNSKPYLCIEVELAFFSLGLWGTIVNKNIYMFLWKYRFIYFWVKIIFYH